MVSPPNFVFLVRKSCRHACRAPIFLSSKSLFRRRPCGSPVAQGSGGLSLVGSSENIRRPLGRQEKDGGKAVVGLLPIRGVDGVARCLQDKVPCRAPGAFPAWKRQLSVAWWTFDPYSRQLVCRSNFMKTYNTQVNREVDDPSLPDSAPHPRI